MDDRSYRIILIVLGITAGGLVLDAALLTYSPPAGAWTVLAAVAAFLGARGALKKGGE